MEIKLKAENNNQVLFKYDNEAEYQILNYESLEKFIDYLIEKNIEKINVTFEETNNDLEIYKKLLTEITDEVNKSDFKDFINNLKEQSQTKVEEDLKKI